MDFRHMFGAKELPTVLNSFFYDSGVKNDLFVVINEANKNVTFEAKTPAGITEERTKSNKIMQGDVLSPLLLSNMVDQNIGKEALSTKNTYLYKKKVEIPFLMM